MVELALIQLFLHDAGASDYGASLNSNRPAQIKICKLLADEILHWNVGPYLASVTACVSGLAYPMAVS